MSWYFGTPHQQLLQQRVDELADWYRTVPGAVNGGRMLGVDDVEALGWDTIFDRLEKDGVITFRVIPVEQIPAVEQTLSERGYRIDWWNVFTGTASSILSRTADETMRTLPEDYTVVSGDDLTSDVVQEMQACMDRNGVRPFSGRIIAGLSEESVSLAVRDADGTIVATACGHFPYNSASGNHRTAWAGLVAVDDAQRGKRLGITVNAEIVRRCVTELGAEKVQEFVNASNTVSRRMVERCGLALDASCMSGMATRGGERFTR
ncbi:GNAT family N-acetyltransferase [Tepidamorphus sp. 3E244]|uniref:GNAT family N-acetyltransferase n=1 Tax=Tepidamorphus sp. 3E244 TaxID=3385498 RepID=UPI0038FCE457